MSTAPLREAKRRFDGKGRLIEEAHYLNGRLDGWRRIWSGAGTLMAEANYKDGKLNGGSRTWHEDGSVQISCEYLDGELHGSYNSYWANGALKEVGVYAQGRRSEYRWFDEKGTMVQEYAEQSHCLTVSL